MMLNLRGLRESASFLLFPVYTFILVISLLIVVGLYNIVTGAVPLQATALPGAAAGCFYRFDLRAFSSGSSSLTGVEAISMLYHSLKAKSKNAAATLTMMALILGFFVGITFINYWYGIVPEKKSLFCLKLVKLSLDMVFCITSFNLLQR